MQVIHKSAARSFCLLVALKVILGTSALAVQNDPIGSGLDTFSPINTGAAQRLSCLADIFSGETGNLKAHQIKLDYTGRISIGDLNGDGNVDFVVANRHKLTAYDLCGKKLWQVDADTNWDHINHVYWNWSNYGYIGDADGVEGGEFLHIGSDWKTLYVRDGRNGTIKYQVDLGDDTKWMYVLLGNRSGEPDHETTRVFVTGSPGQKQIKAIDLRGDTPRIEWEYSKGRIQNAYMPPIAANLDSVGGDEILHSTLALDETGSNIWQHNFAKLSVLGAAHTLTVKDIDPDKSGLEAVVSVYGPKKGMPSIMSFAYENPNSINWQAYSPYSELHAHQHTVGDFQPQSVGLETLARNADGVNHWLVDSQGNNLTKYFRLSSDKLPEDWVNGELVQGIEWDEKTGTEVLYTERRVGFRTLPRLLVTSSTPSIEPKTRLFHGGIDINRIDYDENLADKPDPNFQSWFGYVNRPARYDNDGPYEGAAHVVDLFGDGREEILTWGANKIIIYFNSGNAQVKKRWGNRAYMNMKKMWCSVYNPR